MPPGHISLGKRPADKPLDGLGRLHRKHARGLEPVETAAALHPTAWSARQGQHTGGERAELDPFPLREGPLRQTAVAVCAINATRSAGVVIFRPRPSCLVPVSTSSVVMSAIATDYPVAWLTYRRSPAGRLPKIVTDMG